MSVRVADLTLSITGCRCRRSQLSLHSKMHTKRPRNEFTMKTAEIYRRVQISSRIAYTVAVIERSALPLRVAIKTWAARYSLAFVKRLTDSNFKRPARRKIS